MSFFGKNFAQARLEVHSLAGACGGAFGALARSVADWVISDNFLSVLMCNIIGAFTLSAAISFRSPKNTEFENFIATGFCGGLSIFATFSKVSVGFLKDGDFLKFALFGAANLFFACGLYIWLRPLYRNFFQAAGMRLKTIC